MFAGPRCSRALTLARSDESSNGRLNVTLAGPRCSTAPAHRNAVVLAELVSTYTRAPDYFPHTRHFGSDHGGKLLRRTGDDFRTGIQQLLFHVSLSKVLHDLMI